MIKENSRNKKYPEKWQKEKSTQITRLCCGKTAKAEMQQQQQGGGRKLKHEEEEDGEEQVNVEDIEVVVAFSFRE